MQNNADSQNLRSQFESMVREKQNLEYEIRATQAEIKRVQSEHIPLERFSGGFTTGQRIQGE